MNQEEMLAKTQEIIKSFCEKKTLECIKWTLMHSNEDKTKYIIFIEFINITTRQYITLRNRLHKEISESMEQVYIAMAK